MEDGIWFNTYSSCNGFQIDSAGNEDDDIEIIENDASSTPFTNGIPGNRATRPTAQNGFASNSAGGHSPLFFR